MLNPLLFYTELVVYAIAYLM